MDYLSDLYNAVQLYNTTHDEKANEVILGIQCYRFIKNRVKHMSNWKPIFDDKGILREVLGLNIKIDYFCPNLIEVKRNPYLNDPIGYIWLSKEEIESTIPNDELSTLIDDDLKDLHKFLEFERYYEDSLKDKSYVKGLVYKGELLEKFNDCESYAYLRNDFPSDLEKRNDDIDVDFYSIYYLVSVVVYITLDLNKHLNLYLPSIRVYKIFNKWLNNY